MLFRDGIRLSVMRKISHAIRTFLILALPLAILSVGPLAFAESSEHPQRHELNPSMQCKQRSDVIDYLERRYKEYPFFSGVINGGGLIEIYSTVNGKTWTIMLTTPDGLSCFIAAGEAFRLIVPKNYGLRL